MSKQQHRFIALNTQKLNLTGAPKHTAVPFGTLMKGSETGGAYVETNPRLFYPYPGTFQALAIGAVAVQSAILAEEQTYWIWATVPCHIRLNDGSILATQLDFPFPANVVMEIGTFREGIFNVWDHISVIQLAGSALTGFLYLGRARR